MDLTTIKSWFKKGMKPTEEQFAATFDSFRHKDDHVAEEDVVGLSEKLKGIIDRLVGLVYNANLNTFVIGGKSKVAGKNAIAAGLNCEANGSQSVAIGTETKAEGNHSFASGYQTEASKPYDHVEGYQSIAQGKASHAEGGGSVAGYDGSYNTLAENADTQGAYSHAEGNASAAAGCAAHAEGKKTYANGTGAHAEGAFSFASGTAAHAEGQNTKAKASRSHAEGVDTVADAEGAHAEGVGNHAVNQGHHVSGKYATIDESGNAIFQVGAGTDENNRKDVFKINTDGSIEIQDTEGNPFILQEKLGNLQSQIDGEISTWFYPSSPHNDNTGLDETNKPPLSEWLNTEDYTISASRTYTLKEGHTNHLIDHLGDVYVDSSNHTDLPTSMWESGDVSIDESSIGNEYIPCKVQSTQKLRLKELLPVSIGAVFTVPTPWNITLVYFDSNGKFNGQSKTYSIAQSAVVEDLGAYCSIVIKHPASNNSMPEGLALNPTAGQAWRWCDITSSTDHESVVSAITVQYTKDGSSITKRLHWHKIADSDAVKALLAANENKDRLKNVESSISILSGGINDVSNRLKDKVGTSEFNDKLEEISEELLAKANQSNLDQLEEGLRRDIEALGSGAGGGVNDVSLFALRNSTNTDYTMLKAPQGLIKDTDKVIFARYIKNKTRPRVNGRTDKTKSRRVYKGWVRPRIGSVHAQYPLWMSDTRFILTIKGTIDGYDYFYIEDNGGDDIVTVLYDNSKAIQGKIYPKVVDKKLGIKIVRDGKTIVDYLPFTIKCNDNLPYFGRI